MIRIDGLGFCYQGASKQALSDITLDIRDGDFIGVTGPSGAGKTTLAFALSGVIPHHLKGEFSGSVRIGDIDTAKASPEEIARRVGIVCQDAEGQLLASTAEDEMLFGLENFGTPREEIEDRISYALDSAGITDLRHRTISSLSGGQKRKLAFASITALRPEVIVLDEPTADLDPQSSRRVFETLRALSVSRGATVIIAEQKVMLLCEFADRLAVMDGGRIALEGPVREVLRQGDRLEEAGVGMPGVSVLSRRLKEAGLYSGDIPVSLAEGERMMRKAAADAAF
ncbi:MAG: energy-coupling factor ABC transporter ATP-binding protein [Synergistaceae bacterium]|nr:energy-coupling factor ABC transporter ATP-binding protein [Synergistaceae bacterium]